MCSRSGKSPEPRAELLLGQCATLAYGGSQGGELGRRRMDVVREAPTGAEEAVVVVGVE